MGSEWFWDIIGRARQQPATLKALLWELSEAEVQRFHKEFVILTSELRGAPFDELLYAAGESEDGVMDVAYWVVAQGQEYFEGVLQCPDSIPRHVDVGDPALMHHVAGQVLWEKHGTESDFY